MDTAPQIVPPFAPEERYVYSSATHPIPALQRSDMCSLSQSRINTDSAREGDSVLPFAPEERYVYSSATHPIPRSRGAQCGIVAHGLNGFGVGVGCPNPYGRGTIPRPYDCRHIGHRRFGLPFALCLCTFAPFALNNSSRITLAPMGAPLLPALRRFGYPVVYKHTAPLGL